MQLIIANKNYSSWSMRAWLALKITGASFEETLIPLRQPGSSEKIAQVSPSGTLPLLIDGELKIWDSLAISEYLCEKFPTAGLWPKDPAERAHARAICAEMHSGFTDMRAQLSMNIRAHYPGFHTKAAVLCSIRRIETIWTELLQRNKGEFLFGDFSLADCFYAPVVARFRTYDVSVNDLSRRYMDAVWKHPLVQEWVSAAQAETHRIEDYEWTRA